MSNQMTIHDKLPTRSRKGSPIDRFFLEIVLGLVVVMIMSWSPEKGTSPISADELIKPIKHNNGSGAKLKQKVIAISPSGYWLDGKLVNKDMLFKALKASSVDLILLNPSENTTWKEVAEFWSFLNENNYTVALSH